MRAIQIASHGGPEVMDLVELPDPEAGRGQVVVQLECAGVNYIDTYHRSGLYDVDLPLVLGIEGAGRIVSVGESVTSVRKGQRVAFPHCPGAYATMVVAPEEKLVPVPESMPADVACALMIQGMTAHYLAHDTWQLKPGDVCLVHAAAGGVGLLLVQIAKRLGATVLGTVSTEEKATKARAAGVDHVIFYTKEDFASRVLELTEGEGVSVVYDSVGQSTFEKSLTCLAPRGLMVSFGQSSGAVDPITPLVLGAKSLFLTRPKLFDYIPDRESLLRRASSLFDWHGSGELAVAVGSRFTLADAAQAHRALHARATTGKVVLDC